MPDLANPRAEAIVLPHGDDGLGYLLVGGQGTGSVLASSERVGLLDGASWSSAEGATLASPRLHAANGTGLT